ncbi:MAG: tetratricopeptide repeat protein [Cyanobacteria bacterium SZAS TMP-1]|nr:tetratricopeptide repeat protein [Cyanobacteria bacterium SZAS TMP-1]
MSSLWYPNSRFLPATKRAFLLAFTLGLLSGSVPGFGSGFSSPAFAAGADPEMLKQLNNDGVKALNAQNYQLAIQKLEQALQLNPNYERAKTNLAVAYNNYGLVFQNNPTEAIKYFHKACLLDPNSVTSTTNLNGIIQKMGKNPRDFATRVALGDACRKSADFVGAIVEYREAVKIKPDAAINEKLGDVFRVRDENDNAIAAYQAAAGIADSASIEVKLGQALQAKGDLANAIAAYGRAITMKSDDPDVLDALCAGWEAAIKDNPMAPENHIGYGQALQYKGDFSQSRAEYQQAINLSPGRRNPAAEKLLSLLQGAEAQFKVNKYINLGVDMQSKKQYQAALAAYLNAQKFVLPSDTKQLASIITNMGTVYQAMEDYVNAVKCYQKALSLDPSNGDAAQGLKTAQAGQQDKMIGDLSKQADAEFKAGHYDAAISIYQQLLKNDPKDPAVHFNIGAALQFKKDYDGAISEYTMAISLDPKNESYKKSLASVKDLKAQPIIDQAVALHGQKKYMEAIQLYQQAVELVPQNASLLYNMASAQYAMQDYANARTTFGRTLQLDPKQTNCLYFIATIDENDGKGAQARGEYQQYMAQAPQGTYFAQSKARVDDLAVNPTHCVKIKSEAELAKDADAANAYAKAIDAQKAGSFDDAIALYTKALSIAPQNADYNYGLGTCYQQKGDMDNAIAQYQKALAIMPGNADFKKAIKDANILKAGPLVKQAYDKQTAGDMAGAIQLYSQATQLDPENGSIYMNLAVAYQSSDDFQNARTAYIKSYELDPKGSVDALYLAAAIDENYNQGQQALNRYMTYLQKAPKGTYAAQANERVKALSANITATVKLPTQADTKNAQAASDAYTQAVKFQEATSYDEAIPLYQKAISLSPREPAYIYALATCYQAKGDFDNAIAQYQQAVAKSTGKDQATFKQALEGAKLAQMQPIMDDAVKKHQAGDLDGAIALYEKALALYPNNPHGYTNLAGAYQTKDDLANARKNYMKALEYDPKGESDNWYFVGLIDESNRQIPQAIADYTKYLQAKPTGTYAADAKTRAATIKADPSKAQVIATQSQQKASAAASGAYSDAVALQQANKFDEAIAKYKEAIAAAPNEAAYYYGMGTAYQAKEDLDNALVNYQKANQLNPKEPAYVQVIKQLKQAKAAPLVNTAIEKQTKAGPDGKFDLAGSIADYEAALKIYDDPATHGYLGTAYQAQGNNEKARQEYEKALAMDKTLVDNYYYLGTVYEALKQPAKAVASYQQFMRSAPAGNANTPAVKERLKLLAPGHK